MNNGQRIRRLDRAADILQEVINSLDPVDRPCGSCQRHTYRRKTHLVSRTMLHSAQNKVLGVRTEIATQGPDFDKVIPMAEALREKGGQT